ncbi:hypothetical protein [Noviherbaspirillum galbum]|uniref:Phosphatase PAP2 family protein n=1 Tax=Noviherbaspirillum galbum TaxID=2709383 RepID=A0A6B3STC5_9BURK|nr:hypothetical protein [Noviherbaspirillum galbum]NEX64023.1 hypothetical protein [Noviherbaspirillum galbum]
MEKLVKLVAYLGNASVMIPLACGIAAWLALSGAAGLAWRWMLRFAVACLLVAASKAAYMGWGVALPEIDYNALSGHAMLAAAVFPVLSRTMLGRMIAHPAGAAALPGLGLSVAMLAFLVHFGFHTLSEALGGWLLGCIASLQVIRRLPPAPHASSDPSIPVASLRWIAAACTVIFLASGWLAHGHGKTWIEKAALHLSGRTSPIAWKR